MSGRKLSEKKAAPAGSPVVRTAKVGVVVVDDHPIVREGLVRVIDQTTDLAVCGQAGSTAQALEVIEKTKPGLVVVDLSLGAESGIGLMKDIRLRYPRLPVLVHSIYDEAMYAERCLRAGAQGYVMKQESPQRLLQAIRQVLQGGMALSDGMTRRLLKRISEGKPAPGSSPGELLSDRELEVFELLGRGHTTKEVADVLHLSDKTVQTHREHIKEKLELPDAVSLVREAVCWVEARK